MPYYVYITTNPKQTVLYTGYTNNLARRMQEHYENRGTNNSFAGKYYCYNLVYYQQFETEWEAIQAEKEIKNWKREKKEELIAAFNPTWEFLNYLLE